MAFGWIGSTMPFGEVSARLLWDAISARIKTYLNRNRKHFAINRAFAAERTKKLVLSHNHNDSDAKIKNRVGKTTGRMGMETVRRLRAMASLCRQSARISSWQKLEAARRGRVLGAPGQCRAP
jgi:hypothetical protein